MNSIYQVEFKYSDEKEGWHTAFVLVYQTGTVLGDTIQYALDCVADTGEDDGLNKLLSKQFGITDGDICFYFDRNGIEDESLVLEIEHDFGIIINNFTEYAKGE